MAHFSGSALYVTYRGVVITGDQRNFSFGETVEDADVSAGADYGRSFITTLSTVEGALELVDNGIAGSAIYEEMFNNTGTLVWGPLGTATGNPKYSCAVNITKRDQEYGYDSEVIRKYSFKRTGDWISHFDQGDVW